MWVDNQFRQELEKVPPFFPNPPDFQLFPGFPHSFYVYFAEPQVFLHMYNCCRFRSSTWPLTDVFGPTSPFCYHAAPHDHFLFGFISRLNWISLPQLRAECAHGRQSANDIQHYILVALSASVVIISIRIRHKSILDLAKCT